MILLLERITSCYLRAYFIENWPITSKYVPILIAGTVIGLNDVKVDRRIVLESIKQTDPRVSDRDDNSERLRDTIGGDGR